MIFWFYMHVFSYTWQQHFLHIYGYITVHMNMHDDIMYHLSDITMYMNIHGDITISSNLSPFIYLYTTILDT